MTNVRVAVVYHSGYGHTSRQAQAVREGIDGVTGAESLLLTVEEAAKSWDILETVDAIIFGSPTYMGAASADMKSFMDSTATTVFAKGAWKDKLAAGFTTSASRSGDKLNTLVQFAIFAAQHGMHWVSLGLDPGNNSSLGSEDDINRLGFFLGAGAQANADQGCDVAPPDSDLRTAALLGRRVSETALQFARGKPPVTSDRVGGPVGNGFDDTS